MDQKSAMSNSQPNCQRVSLLSFNGFQKQDGNDKTKRVNNRCNDDSIDTGAPRRAEGG